ncbi:hypothetical protein K4Q22_11910 [Staphylococcus epidermidis]|uniref:hypothetical protein n=1 Tax=Staphylococcus argenteus TaxID=985002 RepID=UPI00285C1D1E|nr:hypothetical protein [Staphylococcus epidermidis]MDR7681235.1 hypothetical protein [Staphylococcus argenteus]
MNINVEKAVTHAIHNSQSIPTGTYKFTEFLNHTGHSLYLNNDEMKMAERDFYNAVQVGQVFNVEFVSKIDDISSLYKKY